MKDSGAKMGLRRTAVVFAMITVFLCSFRCSDGIGVFDEKEPQIVLLKEREIPVWAVYPASENLASTKILFAVVNVSENAEIWAECPDGDLVVSISPNCLKHILSISAAEDFDGYSYVKIIVRDGGLTDEMTIAVELPRIVSETEGITVSCEASSHSVSVDANVDFSARTSADWVALSTDPGAVSFELSENQTGAVREAEIVLHDIYGVVTSIIHVVQNPYSE